MRMVWKTMRLRHLGHRGFFWACSMLTFRSSILLSGSAEHARNIESLVVIVSFVANMTTLLGGGRLGRERPLRTRTVCPSGALPRASWSPALLLVFGPPGAPEAARCCRCCWAGSVVAGVGYGLFWGSWADCYGRMHPARTSFYLPVALSCSPLLLFLARARSCAEKPGRARASLLMLPLPVALARCA